MNPSDETLDVGERSLAALRVAGVPTGPSRELMDATIRRLAAALPEGEARTPAGPHRLGLRVKASAAAVATCAMIVLALVWIGVFENSTTIAFAQVQKEVEAVQSVRYVTTRVDSTTPEERAEVAKLGIESDAFHPRRYLIMGRFLQRTETLGAGGDIERVDIYDATTGKSIELIPAQKRSVITNQQVIIDAETGAITEKDITPTPHPQADFYGAIREIPANATKQLPARMLDGKQAIGFYWEEVIATKRGTDTWSRTYWVDPQSKLPVRIEISHRSTEPRVGPSDWIQTDFAFGEKFDPSLFSTDPLPGYSVETGKIYSID
jgi:outer membrane lipoprotein-sorting protein